MSWFWAGLLLTVLGGFMQGSFTLPQKYLKGWSWEMGWLLYSIFGPLCCTWLLVALVIPHPLEAYANAGSGPVGLAALFGAGWGIGSVAFGLGVAYLGTALGFAIIMSLVAALGALVPLLVLYPEKVMSAQGLWVIVGLLIVVVGVSLCARAGWLRDQKQQETSAAPGGRFVKGLLICILSGVASPMMNFSLAFGDPITKQATSLGADPANASYAPMAIAITAGFFINAGYCVLLLIKNKSLPKAGSGPVLKNTLLTAVMGFFWLFGMFCYSLGTVRLGSLGKVLGWPLFMIIIVVVANVWGISTGEWKKAPPRALRTLAAGNIVLVLALVVLALASQA